MNPSLRIRERARRAKAHIILPEGEDQRVLAAARIIRDEDLAQLTLLGDEARIRTAARALNVPLQTVQIADPAKSPACEGHASALRRRDPDRFRDEAEARLLINGPVWFGAMMVNQGQADGMVAGATHTRQEVVRAAAWAIGPAAGLKSVSGYFLVTLPNYRGVIDRTFVFADNGIVPDPSAAQLADIAIAAANAYASLLGDTPRVALLGFSTRGSGKHRMNARIGEALAMIRARRPELTVDGELQLDVAIVPEIAQLLNPTGPIAGDANVLVFPDANACSIAYRLAVHMAGAKSIGPLIAGLAKPVNDLSPRCTPDDIVSAVAAAAASSAKTGAPQ